MPTVIQGALALLKGINPFCLAIALLYAGATYRELSRHDGKMAVIYGCYGLCTLLLATISTNK